MLLAVQCQANTGQRLKFVFVAGLHFFHRGRYSTIFRHALLLCLGRILSHNSKVCFFASSNPSRTFRGLRVQAIALYHPCFIFLEITLAVDPRLVVNRNGRCHGSVRGLAQCNTARRGGASPVVTVLYCELVGWDGVWLKGPLLYERSQRSPLL